MKTDRELLELAAKAAGIKATGWIGKSHEWFQGEGIAYNNEDDCLQCWNPLIEDGDAFRLAVRLHIGLLDCFIGCAVAIHNGCRTVQPGGEDDPCAATRRAIVRAAAAIGESARKP